MKKFITIAASLVLLLGLMLLTSLPMDVYAIGEVTPTPSPNEPEEEIDVQALLDDGLANLQAGEFRSAVANMDLVLEAEPENTTALLIRGVAFVQLSMYQDAEADFTSAIEYQPWQYDFYIFRGDTYRLMSADIDALLDYDAAIAINPLTIDAFIRRSDLNYDLGDEDAGDFDDFMARGLEAMGSGDMRTAIEFFGEAIDSNVDDGLLAVAYYDRGIGYLNLGNGRSAIADFTSAMEANPNLHNAYLARGIQFRLDGDLAEAGQDFYNRITLHEASRVAEEMVIGDTIAVEMHYRHVVEIQFDGESGQEVSIIARDFGSTLTDPLIALVDPDGNAIAGDDDLGGGLNSAIEDFELPTTGTYTLLVSHAEGGYSFGFEGVIQVKIEN